MNILDKILSGISFGFTFWVQILVDFAFHPFKIDNNRPLRNAVDVLDLHPPHNLQVMYKDLKPLLSLNIKQ